MNIRAFSGVIQRPINKYIDAPLWDAVTFDPRDIQYRIGEVFKALRVVESHFDEFQTHKLESICVQNQRKLAFGCRVFGRFESETQLAEYENELQVAWRGDSLVRGFRSGLFGALPGRTDFWWDLENNVFWSFDRRFMARLPQHLKASFTSEPSTEEIK